MTMAIAVGRSSDPTNSSGGSAKAVARQPCEASYGDFIITKSGAGRSTRTKAYQSCRERKISYDAIYAKSRK